VEAASCGSSYVLCLDDDVALHVGAVGMLVDVMEADAGLFMATGYPFDVLPQGARWAPEELAALLPAGTTSATLPGSGRCLARAGLSQAAADQRLSQAKLRRLQPQTSGSLDPS
jgi:hypothetical protein